jgi:hypothetical protein
VFDAFLLHKGRVLQTSHNMSTFVSSHYQVGDENIKAYLDRKSMKYRTDLEHFVVRECKLCSKPTHGKQDNLWKLYIKKNEGVYFW